MFWTVDCYGLRQTDIFSEYFRIRQTIHCQNRTYTRAEQQPADLIELTGAGQFQFVKPLCFSVERLDDGVIISNKESELTAFGTTIKDAQDDLIAEIEMFWEEIAMEDDSELDAVARDRKKWLLTNIKKSD